MFCKNCGEQFATDDAVICIKCGAQKGTGGNFCQNCGQQTPPNSAVCLNCGVALTGKGAAGVGGKSKLTAGLLGIFLGCFGVHNFYLGYTTKAVIQVVVSSVGLLLSCCTLGITGLATFGMGIWGLVEGIMILCGKIDKDGKGNPLS